MFGDAHLATADFSHWLRNSKLKIFVEMLSMYFFIVISNAFLMWLLFLIS